MLLTDRQTIKQISTTENIISCAKDIINQCIRQKAQSKGYKAIYSVSHCHRTCSQLQAISQSKIFSADGGAASDELLGEWLEVLRQKQELKDKEAGLMLK